MFSAQRQTDRCELRYAICNRERFEIGYKNRSLILEFRPTGCEINDQTAVRSKNTVTEIHWKTVKIEALTFFLLKVLLPYGVVRRGVSALLKVGSGSKLGRYTL